MANRHDDDLAPSKTEGFKVGEKKTLDEYAKLGMDLEGFSFLFFGYSYLKEGIRV